MYSPSEIEKKRQIALQKRQQFLQKKQKADLVAEKSKSPLPAQKPQPLFSNSTNNARVNGDKKLVQNLTKSIFNQSNSNLFNGEKSANQGQNAEKNWQNSATNSKINGEKHQVQAQNPQQFYTSSSPPIKAVAYMISDSRFEINVPYNFQLIDFFKKFTSKNYNMQTKLWNFDITEYENFSTQIKMSVPNVSLVGLPKFVHRTFLNLKTAKKDDRDVDLSPIDPMLLKTLMPFQREGILYGVQKNGRCIIADDMGLGKTIQALGIAHYFRDHWPLLIVTPSSVRYQWSESIYKYLPSVPVQQVNHFTKSKDYLDNAAITIVSYDLLARSIETFRAKNFGTIILDESHVLKNHKAARTQAVQQLALEAKHILLLSGTPALSRPIELYSQISLILRPFMRLQEYGIRYCAAEQRTFGWDYSGSSNVTELQLLLKAHCLLRRLKVDVLKQLPSKIREVVILDDDLISKKTKEMKLMAKKLDKLSQKSMHKTLIEYYNMSAEQRVKAVCNYISELLENEHKFLVYAHHVLILDAICGVLDKKKIKYMRIDGSTNAENRKFKVDMFQNDDQCMVAVLSITAANAGLTLTAANFVVFAELYWNPGILTQAEDRVHRIGQDRGVVIRYLVGKNTVDDYLWPMIQSKSDFLANAGLNIDFSLNEATVYDQKQTATIDQFMIHDNEENKDGANESRSENGQAVEQIPEEMFDEDFDMEDWDSLN